MTPAAYRIWRLGRELTHADMARLADVEPGTSRRWEDGTRSVPPPVARLLSVCERHPAVLEELLD